jgi:transposase-like protein
MRQLSFETSHLLRDRHFAHAIIILCVRWYVTYKLSYRALVASEGNATAGNEGLDK